MNFKQVCRYLSFLLPVLVCLFLLAIYFPRLRTYQLSGDDLILITYSPKTFSEGLARFTQISGQYRPLTHNLFALYRAMLPHTSLILATNFVLMSVVVSLTFLNMKRLCRPIWAAVITAALFLSPIFYYHFFSISALNNTLLLLFGLLLLGLVSIPGAKNVQLNRKVVLGSATALFLLSMISKESFLVNGVLYGLILLQQTAKQQRWISLSALGVVVATYFIARFTLHDAVGEYSVRFSVATAAKSLLDLLAWLVGYPRGWQYGAPEPKTFFTYLTTLVTLVSLGLGVYLFRPLKLWRETFLGIVLLGASIVPFLIIERVLPFYFDTTLLIIVFLLVYGARHVQKNVSHFFYALLIFSFGLQFLCYSRQWHTYSFVANANAAVQSYLQTLREHNYTNFDQVCIVNHTTGTWGTMQGESVTYLYEYQGKVISVAEDQIPEECRSPETLVLRNDGLGYSRVTIE